MVRRGVTGDWIGTFLGHKGAIWYSKLSTNWMWAITASADFTVKVWNATTGDVMASLGHNHIVRTCDFHPQINSLQTLEGVLIVTGGDERKIRIWDAENALVKREWDVLLDGNTTISYIKALLWISRNIIISASISSTDSYLNWWDISDSDNDPPKTLHTLQLGPSLGQVSAERGWIVASVQDCVYFINTDTAEIEIKHQLEYQVSACSVNSDKSKFVTGCSDDTWVRLHCIKTGEVLDTYKGHHGPVHAISYSPDGALIASGSEDGTIRLWKATQGPYGLWR